MRLLLPSYWWKRAFGAVIDNTVSADSIKTINGESFIGEGDLRVGVKNVESVEALESLDAVVGDIATVAGERKEINLNNAYTPTLGAIKTDWHKLTRICKVEELNYTGTDAVVVILCDKDGLDSILYQVIHSNDGKYYYIITDVVNNSTTMISLDRLNTIILENDIRYIGTYEGIDSSFAFKFYGSASADAYIKADSWDKLSKEHVVSSEEDLNSLDVPIGTIAKVASGGYMSILDCYQLQDGEIVKNAFDKLTPVKGISLSVASGSFANQVIVSLSSQAGDLSGLMLIVNEGNKVWCTDVKGEHNYAIIENGIVNKTALNDFNALLKENDYRYGGCLEKNLQTEASEEAIAYIDTWLKVSSGVVSDAYIKGETWKRLLKEGDVTGGTIEQRELYFRGDDVISGNVDGELTQEQLDYNLETIELYKRGEVSLALNTEITSFNLKATCYPISYLESNGTTILCCELNAIIAQTYVLVVVSPTGDAEAVIEEMQGITVDSALSTTSTNAVQNKVVTSAINERNVCAVEDSGVIDDVNVSYATSTYVDNALNGKVDKSSLASVATSGNYNDLSNKPTITSYDDTEIRDLISKLEDDIEASKQGYAFVSGETLTFSSSSISIQNNTLIL